MTLEPEPTTAEPGPEPATAEPAAPATPPVSQAVRIWPRVGAVMSGSFDLLTASRVQIRNVSLYYGLLGMLTTGPFVLVFIAEAHKVDWNTLEGLSGWAILAGFIAVLGLLAIAYEGRLVASAILGGARIGQPVSRTEAVRLARREFWHFWWPALAAAFAVGIPARLLGSFLDGVFGSATDAAPVGSNLLGALIGVPFIYIATGVVLGGVGGREVVRRSIRLARARYRLAVMVSVFAVLAQYLLGFAASAGLDVAGRALEPFHRQLERIDPAALSGFIPLGAAGLVVVLAYFSLAFTIEALISAPQVVAFIGLTGYTRGLDGARERPLDEPRLPRPALISRPMIVGAAIAWMAAAFAVAGALGPS